METKETVNNTSTSWSSVGQYAKIIYLFNPLELYIHWKRRPLEFEEAIDSCGLRLRTFLCIFLV